MANKAETIGEQVKQGLEEELKSIRAKKLTADGFPKIKSVYLHTGTTVPGSSVLGTVNILPDKHKNVKMEEGAHGVVMRETMVSASGVTRQVHALIPYPAIQVIIYE